VVAVTGTEVICEHYSFRTHGSFSYYMPFDEQQKRSINLSNNSLKTCKSCRVWHWLPIKIITREATKKIAEKSE
jgi:hypothetical protein